MDTAALLTFLKELDNNNNKEWFEKHKPRYQSLKEDFEIFVADLINDISKSDPLVKNLEPKKCIYRIYRDVRFSKDKTPYKTNFGAAISYGGRKSQYAGYYMHIEPGNKSMFAGGVYHPEGKVVHDIRQEIDYNVDEFKGIIRSKSFKKYFPELWSGDQLKTAPKGYPKDHPDIDILKNRSFLVLHEIEDSVIKDEQALNKEIITAAKELKPFLDFLNRGIGLEL